MLVSAWSWPPHGRSRRVSDGILAFRSKSHGYAWWRLGNEVRNGGALRSVSVQLNVLPAETPNRLSSPVCSASHRPTSGTTATVHTRSKCYATLIFGRKAGAGARSNRPKQRCAWVARQHGLSAREGEVLVLLVKGLTRQGICNELHLSEGTVKTHLAHIYEKLGIHSQAELLEIAYDVGDRAR